jgi:hypothetical protein
MALIDSYLNQIEPEVNIGMVLKLTLFKRKYTDDFPVMHFKKAGMTNIA